MGKVQLNLWNELVRMFLSSCHATESASQRRMGGYTVLLHLVIFCRRQNSPFVRDVYVFIYSQEYLLSGCPLLYTLFVLPNWFQWTNSLAEDEIMKNNIYRKPFKVFSLFGIISQLQMINVKGCLNAPHQHPSLKLLLLEISGQFWFRINGMIGHDSFNYFFYKFLHS